MKSRFFAFIVAVGLFFGGIQQASAWEYRVPGATLLFLQNSNKLVERWSNDQISHVGMIFYVDGKPWVYEATPAKVRRLPLDEYYEEIAMLNYGRSRKIRVWLREPNKPYTKSSIVRMQRFLDDQVGRRYSVKGIVRGRKGDGVHCSELTANTLNRGKRLEFDSTHKITPASLYDRINGKYEYRYRITIHDQKPPGTWCSRTWDCVVGSVSWAGWCCRDTWSWIW